jgi:hypothetical protein
MTKNIKQIQMWMDNPQKDRVSAVVKVDFNFPCTWTVFDLKELETILRSWMAGEYYRWKVGDNRKMFKDWVTNILNDEEQIQEKKLKE